MFKSLIILDDKMVWFMVFKATFNNISVISWQSVLLVEETEVPGENHDNKRMRSFDYTNVF